MVGVAMRPSRKGFETALVSISVVSGLAAAVLAFVLLISGTTSIRTHGSDQILLKDLALVSVSIEYWGCT